MGILQGLVSNDGHLHAMWKGIPDDDRLFHSSWSGSGHWTPQAAVAGNTSTGPGLGVLGGHVFAAWKGEWSDFRLFFNKLNGSTWTAQAQIPDAYSDVGPSLAGFGGKLFAAWKNAWDETICYASWNGAHWSGIARIAGAATSVGPSLAEFDGKLYAAWKDGGGSALWYASFNGTHWSATAQLPGAGSDVGPSLAVLGTKLYAVWKTPESQTLWYSSFDGTHWAPAVEIPGASSSIGAAIATLDGKLYAVYKGPGQINSLYDTNFDGTQWAAPANHIAGNTGQDPLGAPVAAPAGGLGSNSNYIFYDQGKNLTQVTASVWITQTVTSSNGFGFQLNCYSPHPKNDDCAWQQYCMVVTKKKLVAIIQTWPVHFGTPGHFVDLFLDIHTLHALTANELAAGYQLTIELTSDQHANITGARFIVVDNHGKTVADVTRTMLDLHAKGFTAADEKPINGFELNLVGPDDSASTRLTSGQGIFILSAKQPLTVINHEPAGATIVGTAETANSVYSTLPKAYGNGAFFQLFNAGTTLAPMDRRAGTARVRIPKIE
jgi:hypothetical protein